MSAYPWTDWIVSCDYEGCPERVAGSEIDLNDPTAATVRKTLKRRGWAVGLPAPGGPADERPGAFVPGRAVRIRPRSRRQDFCPNHKP